LTDYYIKQQNYRSALVTNNSLNETSEEIEAYKKFKRFEIGIKSQGRMLNNLNTLEIWKLNNIANTNTNAGIKARNALLHYYDSTTVVIPPPIQEEQQLRKLNLDAYTWLELEQNNLVSPNPAINFINVNLPSNLFENSNYNLRIINTNGQIIKEVRLDSFKQQKINTSNFNNGLYLFEIILKDKAIVSEKVIINR